MKNSILRLCTKDCLCLYVCPTGATDTENSIIDVNKCIGCGACADACPSSAISMVPKNCPPQQKKEDLCREAGFILPQSGNTKQFLDTIRNYPDIPQEEVEFLLKSIHFNEKTEELKMEK